jgi:SulP family sulfate permease
MASLIMLTTVAVVVLTHNLAAGVLVGVLMSTVSFARKVARLTRIGSSLDESGEHRTYTVVGQLFFVSSAAFLRAFNFKEVLTKVTIDVTHAHFWDITAVATLDKVVIKFRRDGTEVEIMGMNEASATLVGKYAIHDKPGAMSASTGH